MGCRYPRWGHVPQTGASIPDGTPPPDSQTLPPVTIRRHTNNDQVAILASGYVTDIRHRQPTPSIPPRHLQFFPDTLQSFPKGFRFPPTSSVLPRHLHLFPDSFTSSPTHSVLLRHIQFSPNPFQFLPRTLQSLADSLQKAADSLQKAPSTP